jgi:hypothetical protein
MHACSLQISRMASGDELRLNTLGCPGMARLVRRPKPDDACSTRCRSARFAKQAYEIEHEWRTSRRAHGGVSERRGAQRYVDYDRFYPNLVVEIEIRNEFSILQILVEVEVFSALREDCPLQG